MTSALTSTTFSEALEQAQLSQYWPLFQENHLDDSLVPTLTAQELASIGVESLGHRKRILRLIEETFPAAREQKKQKQQQSDGDAALCDISNTNTGVPRTKAVLSPRDDTKKRARPQAEKKLKIAVEGNIASGKSTFLRFLAKEVDFTVVPEPVSRWQNVQGEDNDEEDLTMSQKEGGNLLDMFYRKPNRWAYTFQSYACLSRIKAQMREDSDEKDLGVEHDSTSDPSPRPKKKARTSGSESSQNGHRNGHQNGVTEAQKDSVLFFERSVFSDRFCFATNCHESGLFDDTEWNIYCDWHEWLVNTFSSLDLHAFVYLRSKPDTCIQRLQRRARSEETSVDLDYLTKLHEKHERWLVEKQIADVFQKLKSVPVLILEVDKDFESHPEHRAELMQQVRDFIETLSK